MVQYHIKKTSTSH